MGECSGPDAQRAEAGEKAHGHHVLHGHVGDAHAAALLDAFQKVLDKSVHPLAQTLEHDKSQRDPQDGIKHAEGLPRVSPRRCVPVAWEESRKKQKWVMQKHVRVLLYAVQISFCLQTWPSKKSSKESASPAKKSIEHAQCVCSLILFGLKDYGRRGVQLVWS